LGGTCAIQCNFQKAARWTGWGKGVDKIIVVSVCSFLQECGEGRKRHEDNRVRPKTDLDRATETERPHACVHAKHA
jgi:hypothetical protein